MVWWRPSQFYNGNPYTDMTVASWWLEGLIYSLRIREVYTGLSLVQVMVFRLLDTKPLPDLGWISSPHYSDVIMGVMASQITGVWMVYSTVCSGADKKNIEAPRHWPLLGEFTGKAGEFPAQRGSNAENVSNWWRHHATSYLFSLQTTVHPVPAPSRRRRHQNITPTTAIKSPLGYWQRRVSHSDLDS